MIPVPGKELGPNQVPLTDALLKDSTVQQGVSKQEATVRAIREAASRRLHRDNVASLSAAARDRYADLLDRLGQ